MASCSLEREWGNLEVGICHKEEWMRAKPRHRLPQESYMKKLGSNLAKVNMSSCAAFMGILPSMSGKCELVSEIKSDDKKTFCYDVPGGGWLGKEGFDGQCFEFSLFRLHNANTNEELNSLANLKGLNGEPAEFSQLKWLSFEDVIKTVWEVKRPAYQACYDVVKKMGAI
eukprot:m.13503 g.13503  ORF g.13503 m.13503 type:complete len:170 (-) comp4868_c0_seq2:209-718(-)